ncbi:MAG: hypothetical protein ACI9QQ_000769 [Myxococcota bacterium]|jgi:hypothetical protein
MLRASVEYNGTEANLRAITEGSKSGDSGVVHGAELTAFAEAAVSRDEAALATARDTLRSVAGSAAVVDAAGVIGNFQRMVRIADGSGIALDTSVVMLSGDFREELGLDDFDSAGHTKELGGIQSTLAPLLRGVVKLGLGFMGRRSRHE